MQLQVTKSNTLNAVSWIKNGWRLFTLQPGPFMGMSAIILFISLIGNLNPIAGVIALFMAPFLTAGFYQAATRAEKGESLNVSDIFSYFSKIAEYRIFLRISVLSLLFSIPITQVALSVQETLLAGSVVDFQTSVILVSLMALNFMLMAFVVPAAWVAPETPLLVLVKQSFKACWINPFPLGLYGIMIFVLGFISMPIIIIGWLIMYAVSVLSFYQMFLSVYQPVSVGSDAVDSQDEDVESASQEDEEQQDSLENVEKTESDRQDN